MWPNQSSISLPLFKKSKEVRVVDRLASNQTLYEVCDSNAEICGSFSDLNGVRLSLNKIVKAKIIVHVFIFYQSFYWYLEHYALIISIKALRVLMGTAALKRSNREVVS